MYRSETIGSLLRPAYLKEAREQLASGKLAPPPAFKQIEDRAVEEAIGLQESAGLDIITGGEMRRFGFVGHFFESVHGFEFNYDWVTHFKDESGTVLDYPRPVVVEKLKWLRSMCSEEWVFLRSKKSVTGKVTMLSAQQASSY